MTTIRKMGRLKRIEVYIQEIALALAGHGKRIYDLEVAVDALTKKDVPCEEEKKDQPK